MAEYIIADPEAGCGWTHIWRVEGEGGLRIEVERLCRFVLDQRSLRLIQVDIDRDGAMVPATAGDTGDLLDSLVNANPELIDDPESKGLTVNERLPVWCKKARPARAAPVGRKAD